MNFNRIAISILLSVTLVACGKDQPATSSPAASQSKSDAPQVRFKATPRKSPSDYKTPPL